MVRIWAPVLIAVATASKAAVTVYRVGDHGAHGTATTTADAASYTGSAAYDPTVLVPPPPPEQFNRDFVIVLGQGDPPGISIPIPGSYLGFSIELSVANRAIGVNSTVLAVPFLNHIANVANRGGAVRIRVGGNTQERAILQPDGFPGGEMLIKTSIGATTTSTPHVEFSPELIKMLANIANLVKSEIYLVCWHTFPAAALADVNDDIRSRQGLNFMDLTDTSNQVAFAAMAEEMLGSNLHGIALGNEPDLYERPGHQKRPEPYTFEQYMDEWGSVAGALATNPGYSNHHMLMGPSTCCESSNPRWNNLALAGAGYLQRFTNELKVVTVQRYPNNNCQIEGAIRDPQQLFPIYLSHDLLSQHAAEYAEFSRIVQEAGKPLFMFETNTAACGGFPGISDSFGAGLWAVDWALKLATYNFSATLFHVGGQGDYYNPFTPPPTNQSTFRQWTTGSVYYSTLIIAELFGKSGKSRIMDLNPNNGENLTPGYVVYEDGQPTRMLLINYVDDPSGGHDIWVRIQVGGGETQQPPASPAQVRVKYFEAPSVSFKGNMTWAGQTLGNHFESDGRLKGQEVVHTIDCDPITNQCSVPLRAPSLALVFVTEAALQNSSPEQDATASFETTFLTRVRHTATVEQEVLATSNGRGGRNGHRVGSTSFGSIGNGMAPNMGLPGMSALMGIALGTVMVMFYGN
ncbi:Glycosyl hydrolase family 79 C-terminal beta domain [Rhizoctonia solani]|uniref:Glycosyl hydrolase family 79 C-terminal beta domain n=1 Tax=Rhizoctonia solani TaxID=456999 RepID=A0A8H7H1Y6_9AGAM|nr:Glycosyl hydrolase family 79 C-terminal beta domain [Rhizoctonia solani]